MIAFADLQEKLKLQRGEKVVKTFKSPKKKKDISITDFGGKGFMLYYDGQAVDDSVYDSVKDAETSAKQLMKMLER